MYIGMIWFQDYSMFPQAAETDIVGVSVIGVGYDVHTQPIITYFSTLSFQSLQSNLSFVIPVNIVYFVILSSHTSVYQRVSDYPSLLFKDRKMLSSTLTVSMDTIFYVPATQPLSV
jgi:hypothetical protein